MRALRQPGPVAAARAVSVAAHARPLDFTLTPGQTLNDALCGPMRAAGFAAGAIVLSGGVLEPASFVIPHPSPDADHVAYFSPARATVGPARIVAGCATFGVRDGGPFVHVHATWEDEFGMFGGHLLPHETIIRSSGTARAYGCADAAIVAVPDAETNFTLFEPRTVAGGDASGARASVVRIRPNEDFAPSLAAACARAGFARARLFGCVGSLIGAAFVDGRALPDTATEIFVRDAMILAGQTPTLDLVAIDMVGGIHAGRIAEQNPVCITVEALLIEA
jgi:predicted DNA-binding protein with PD1-like motif